MNISDVSEQMNGNLTSTLMFAQIIKHKTIRNMLLDTAFGTHVIRKHDIMHIQMLTHACAGKYV